MTKKDGVWLCPLRMQECHRGEEACPYQPLCMGEDCRLAAWNAEACEMRGRDLPAYYYRGLERGERERYGPGRGRDVLKKMGG